MPWNNNNKSPWNNEGANQNQDPNKEPNILNMDEILKKIKSFFYNKKNGLNNKNHLLAIIVIISLWLSSGFYKIDEGEQAVILRFGKFNRVSYAGLNFHIPAPIEIAYKAKVDRVESEDLGSNNLSDKSFNSRATIKSSRDKSLMLTGDENIIDINFVVQWKINNIEKYMFNVLDPQETVRSAAESAMRDVIGSNPIAAPLTEGKSEIELSAKNLLQNILDSYDIGITITNLRMARVDPPYEVIDAFRDVQTARSDKEREINNAEAYKNDVIPRARGEAANIISEAEAYKQKVVSLATGEVSRFNAIYNEYKNAKVVTKQRLYIESMESVLKDIEKIIVSPEIEKNILPYLPLSKSIN